VEYLAACPPSGLPVALGGIDYAKTPGAGTIWQLAVHAALQSCGIGTILIQAAEQRIRARGLHRAELGVEDGNPRARALYERLGYRACGREPYSWDQAAPDGTITRYDTMVTLMRRGLPWPQPAAIHWLLLNCVQRCVQRAVVKLGRRSPVSRDLLQQRGVRVDGRSDPGPGVRTGDLGEPGGPCVSVRTVHFL
jgi:hypothetical protein